MSTRNEQLQETIKDMSAAHDTFMAKHDNFIAEHKTKHAELLKRLEDLEAKASRPGRTGFSSAERLKEDHVKAFCDFLKKPTDGARKQMLENIEQELHRKDMLIGTPASGGYLVPEELGRQIERLEHKFSPVRDLVSVINVSSSDFRMVLNQRGTTAGWCSETGTRSNQSTPT